MNTVAIIATGKSLTAKAVGMVRHLPCVAVSDAYRLAPWAAAMVSADKSWWRHHDPDFSGRKFTLSDVSGVEKVNGLLMGSNSGLLACHVAVEYFEANRLLLLGVDMQGSHYFGPHPTPLKNTTEARFKAMKQQFAEWHYQHKRVEVWNCNPDSALTCFPRMTLEAAFARLAESQAHAA